MPRNRSFVPFFSKLALFLWLSLFLCIALPSISKGRTIAIRIQYFSEATLCHLKPQQGLSVRYQQRAIDVTPGCKLTQAYGKYHLAMLHRELFMSEEKTSYEQAERMAAMMNQLTVIHSSPSDFLQTKEESVDECIDTYKEGALPVLADCNFIPNRSLEF